MRKTSTGSPAFPIPISLQGPKEDLAPFHSHMPGWRLHMKQQYPQLPAFSAVLLHASPTPFPPPSVWPQSLFTADAPQTLSCKQLCIQNNKGSECSIAGYTLGMRGHKTIPGSWIFRQQLQENREEKSMFSWLNFNYTKPTRNTWNKISDGAEFEAEKQEFILVTSSPDQNRIPVVLLLPTFLGRENFCTIISFCVAAPHLTKFHPFEKLGWFGKENINKGWIYLQMDNDIK